MLVIALRRGGRRGDWYKSNHPDVCRGQLAEDVRFGGADAVTWAAGKLAFNWMSRPDFVAYDYRNGSSKLLAFARKMGTRSTSLSSGTCW